MKPYRQIAETYLQKNPQITTQWTERNIQELVNELLVHQIELEIQNEELRLSQDQLEESRNKYIDLFEFAPVSYFVLDQNGIIMMANLNACTQFDLEKESLLKKPFLSFVSKKSQTDFLFHRDQSLQSSKVQTANLKILKKKGEDFFAQMEIITIRDLGGNFEHYLLSLTDITIQNSNLEKQRQIQQLKSEFITLASHEFRTPLGVILSSATLIGKYRNENEKEKRDQHLDKIKTSVIHLSEILQNLLSLENLESHSPELEFSDFELSPFIEEVIAESQAQKRLNQILYCQQDEEAKTKIICFDKKILKIILIHLLSNSFKYSAEEGIITLKSSIGNNRLKLTIQDLGFGIPEEEKKRVFTRFFRGSNVQNISGIGLSLSLVKKYVDLLGGSIFFESKLNKGTTFFLEFPLRS